jgi:DNA polymerase-1
MLLHHLYNETLSHKLKDIVREFFSQFANYETDLGKKDWANIKLENLARYGALDSDLTLRLYWVLIDYFLETDKRLYIYFRNYIAPATKALFEVEENGMLIDKAYLTEAIRQVEEFIVQQEASMRAHEEVIRFEEISNQFAIKDKIEEFTLKYEKECEAEYKSKQAKENQEQRKNLYLNNIQKLKSGEINLELEPINFNSPDQLTELLFSSNGFGFIPPKDSYKRDNTSTGAENLDLIKDKSGFLEELKIYRQLKRILSTYLNGILTKLDDNHFVHTSLLQHGTTTGRLSSKNPNLQNIISRTKYKVVEESVAMVKESFIVPKDCTLIQADYSQVELRVIAFFANETTMLRAYQNNEDLHELTAANVTDITVTELKAKPEKEYKNLRFKAKAINFGFVYGMSAKGFKDYCRTDYNIDITQKEAERLREAYFKKYPMLLKYHSEYIHKARKFKYVRTFLGRTIHLPDIDSDNRAKQGHAERNAINGPIQGTAGELTIFALTLLSLRLPKYVKIINTIHDSILFYCPNSKIDEILPLIRDTMEKLPLKQYFEKEINSVPIKVEFECSKENWKDLHS